MRSFDPSVTVCACGGRWRGPGVPQTDCENREEAGQQAHAEYPRPFEFV